MIGIGIGSGSGGGGSGSVSPIGASLDLIFRDPLGVEFGAPRTIAGTTTVAGWPNLGTFTRASTADWINVAGDGLETQAANNVLRRGPVRGALFEQGVTAQPVNSALVGAVAGSPGTLPTGWGATQAGLTREVVSVVGTKIRIRLFGTANAAFCEIRPAATPVASVAQGQRWTGQVLAGLTVNSGTVPGNATIAVNELDSTSTFLTNSTSIGAPLTATPRLLFHSRTMTNASVSRTITPIVIVVTSGQTYDFTVEIEAFTTHQGELTSPILTTNSGAVTRAADQLVIPVSLPETTWTIAGVATMPGTPNNTNENLLNLGLSTNERFSFRRDNANLLAAAITGGSATGTVSVAAPSLGARFAFCIRRNGTQLSLSINGGALVNTTPSTMPPGAMPTLSVGHRIDNQAQWNSYIERMPVFPTAVSDATMQTYSTLATWGA
jgi:hypothetical protein